MHKKLVFTASIACLASVLCGTYAYAETKISTPKVELRELIDIESATPLIDIRARTDVKRERYAAAIVELNNELNLAFQAQLAIEEENKRLRELLLKLHNRLNDIPKQ